LASENAIETPFARPNKRIGHVCAFFESDAELRATLASVGADVLSEFGCLSKLYDPARRLAEVEEMNSAGVSMETLANPDRYRLESWDEAYLAGGTFDGDRMLAHLESYFDNVGRTGREATVIGDMGWVLDQGVNCEEVLMYEHNINKMFPRSRALVICAYDLAKVGPEIVMYAVQTHPHILVNGKLMENPLFVEHKQSLLAVPNKANRIR
jgi:hypothetical protein